ncbi:uncharacterized protein LOC110857744 [Folsomia candida]|uniref:Uncharacterized protein n=1 Tax=Folsomia candida TaxID=158441 RepID=A0A226DGB2_FOLCA|nr:uncharacterized protein LOC110857744 [Folsomia candida]OXA44243.1 hypothetical protein Fcan01_20548 [Folsomia candida]
MGSNPLPANFGANLAKQIRDSLRAGGIGGGQPRGGRPAGQSDGQAAPPPNSTSRRLASGTGTEGGHHFEQCTGDITLTTQVVGKKALTPDEEAKARRGAAQLARYETEETRDMTDEQLHRLVLLEKLRKLRGLGPRGVNVEVAPEQVRRPEIIPPAPAAPNVPLGAVVDSDTEDMLDSDISDLENDSDA